MPTVPLVTQQATYICQNTNLRVFYTYGGKSTGNIDRETWEENLISYDVFVMTPAILELALAHGSVSMKQVIQISSIHTVTIICRMIVSM